MRRIVFGLLDDRGWRYWVGEALPDLTALRLVREFDEARDADEWATSLGESDPMLAYYVRRALYGGGGGRRNGRHCRAVK